MNLLKNTLQPLLSVLGVSFALHTACFADTIIPGNGSPAGSLNGIALSKFQVDGTKLYVASTVDSKIFVVDTITGDTLDIFDHSMGILGPDDLIIDQFGNLYYTDTLGGFVGYIDVEARSMTPITTPGQYFLINSIAMSDDKKHIYAGVCFLENLPNKLIDIDLWNHTVTELPLDMGSGCSINGMTYHGGYLYGAQSITGYIYRVGPFNQPNTSPSVHVVVQGNDGAGQCQGNDGYFVNPAAVKFDSQGRLFVIDSYDNTLHRIDNPLQDYQTPVYVGKLPLVTGVDSLAIDKINNDRTFISSAIDAYLIEVNPSNAQTVNTLEPSGLVLPLGVAVVGTNKILVTDYSSLRKINTQTKTIEASFQTTTKGFICHNGIVASYGVAPFVIGSAKHCVINNSLERRIQIFDFDTNTVMADLQTEPEGFGRPLNVVQFPASATDPRTSVISVRFNSANLTSYVVQNIYDALTGQLLPGRVLRKLPPIVIGTTVIPGLLNGLATDGTNLYMGDYFLGRIFRTNINSLLPPDPNNPPPPSPIAGGFAQPQGLAVDTAGNLLVVELTTKQLTKLNLTDHFGQKTVIATNLPIQNPNAAVGFLLVCGVAVDPANGDIYYTGCADRSVQRIPFGTTQIDKLLPVEKGVPVKKVAPKVPEKKKPGILISTPKAPKKTFQKR